MNSPFESPSRLADQMISPRRKGKGFAPARRACPGPKAGPESAGAAQ